MPKSLGLAILKVSEARAKTVHLVSHSARTSKNILWPAMSRRAVVKSECQALQWSSTSWLLDIYNVPQLQLPCDICTSYHTPYDKTLQSLQSWQLSLRC